MRAVVAVIAAVAVVGAPVAAVADPPACDASSKVQPGTCCKQIGPDWICMSPAMAAGLKARHEAEVARTRAELEAKLEEERIAHDTTRTILRVEVQAEAAKHAETIKALRGLEQDLADQGDRHPTWVVVVSAVGAAVVGGAIAGLAVYFTR